MWLAVAVAGRDHLGSLVLVRRADLAEADRRILERGTLVTALLLLFGRSVGEAEDRIRGELLSDLLSDPHRDPAALRARASRHRADLDTAQIVLVVRTDGVERHRAVSAAARLAAAQGGLGGQHDADVVLALPGGDAARVARSVRDRLADLLGATVTVGAAGPATGPEKIATAYHEARRCLTVLLTLARRGEAADAAGLGFAQLLLGGGASEVETFLTATVGPVLAYDEARGTELATTLEAWFATGGSPARAAERLHVHPNTVAQRLDRVTALLGTDWRTPERALEVHVALRLWRLRSASI